ncbi:MAG: DUF4340 domain-containing protein [Oligoflexia bacterium]|nr:DUF4340 domain-containing protein [Oligoflexia bacterium]
MFMAKLSKDNKSTWIIIAFIFFTVAMALFSELYQTPFVLLNNQNIYQNPLSPTYLDKVNHLTIKNNVETVELALKQISPESNEKEWWITAPKYLPANPQIVEEIISGFKNFKISKILGLDTINKANFSLDKPALQIILSNELQKSITISFGIVNSIDNSTYITISNQRYVFQIKNCSPFTSLGLGNLPDSRLFPMNYQQISAVNITHKKIEKASDGDDISENSSIAISKDQPSNSWINDKGEKLSTTKVNIFLTGLLSLKGHLILDKKSHNIQRIINKYLDDPQITIELTNKQNTITRYYISAPIRENFTEFKNLTNNVIVKAANREHPIITSLEVISLLKNEEKKLLLL